MIQYETEKRNIMKFQKSKVVIVGVGNVGATTAYSIINQGLCEEIVLIDVNK